MTRTGIVMEIKNNRACIMTGSGEFLNVKCRGSTPQVGQVYSGEQIDLINIYKLPLVAASILVMMFFSTMAYAYYVPVASVMVKINPSLELKINRWDRIIKVRPLNKDGEVLASSVDIKNKKLNRGLKILMDEAAKEKLLNRNNAKNSREITLTVRKKKEKKQIDFSEFINYASQKNVDVKLKDKEDIENENPEPNDIEQNKNNNVNIENQQNNEVKVKDKQEKIMKHNEEKMLKKQEKELRKKEHEQEKVNKEENDNENFGPDKKYKGKIDNGDDGQRKKDNEDDSND